MTSDNTTRTFRADFWFTYLANTSLMITVSMMFRYADFVTHLGGTELELGWIVGIGMTGAILIRVVQGIGIDRYGPARIWMLSLVMVLVSLLAHLFIQRIDSPWVYLARIVYATSLAGSFGASITFVSVSAPRHRTAEMIGTLGSSGFVGIAIGPALADWILSAPEPSRSVVNRLFTTSAAIVCFSIVMATIATRLGTTRRVVHRRYPIGQVLKRYHPGMILLVAVCMGIGIGIPFSFLRTFADERGIDGIRTYFWIYAGVAFVVRITTRQLPDRWGVRPTLLMGIVCLIVSMLSYLVVDHEWTLVLPAVFGGLAHAFTFPAAVAGGSLAFPMRYRGLATTLMLAMFDIGALIGPPLLGTIVHSARQANWPAYPAGFITIAGILGLIGILYLVSPATAREDSGRDRRLDRQVAEESAEVIPA